MYLNGIICYLCGQIENIFGEGARGAYAKEDNVKAIPWNRRYEIGVESIDKQHKQLFATINKLLVLGDEEEKKSGYAVRALSI